VLCLKYRKKLLVGSIKEDMLQIINNIATEKGFIFDEMQSDINHIHILIDVAPKFSALEIVHQIKQISTFRLYKTHKTLLKKHFWKENTFWSDGYFVCSTGNASTDTIKKYIAEHKATFAFSPYPKGIGDFRSNS
jgi:putative transposase